MTEGIIIAILGSSTFTVIVNALVELIKGLASKKRGTTKAINFCLLTALQGYGERLIEKQSASPEEIKQFLEMYNLYKKQGGNGYADRLKAEVDKIPL